jgi:hypothetical protein
VARNRARNKQNLAALLVWSVILVPVTVLVHELAHWLVARSAGFPAQLHFASVSGFPEQAPFGGAPIAVGLVALAGPAMTLAFVGLGMANARHAWGKALVATALPRFALNAVYMFQQSLVLAGIAKASAPNFDEAVAGRALALPPQLLASVGALVLVIGLIWLWRRAGARGFALLVLGTAAGLYGWMGILGPRLLP